MRRYPCQSICSLVRLASSETPKPVSSRVQTMRHSSCVSLWHTCDTAQCRDHLEEKSHDEQEETVHGQRKCSIGRWLTLSLNRSSTAFGTQQEYGRGIPGSLL